MQSRPKLRLFLTGGLVVVPSTLLLVSLRAKQGDTPNNHGLFGFLLDNATSHPWTANDLPPLAEWLEQNE